MLIFLKLLQERFEDWQSTGVNIVQVLSHPDDSWRGERGFVQVVETLCFHKLRRYLHWLYDSQCCLCRLRLLEPKES